MEHEFVKKVKSIIAQNLDLNELSGDFIGHQLGLSRMQLHRKFKTLTNQAVGEYIREMRLQRARQLLATGNFNISEVCYQAGFNSPAYFSTTFKKRFGIPPSELLKLK